MFLFSNFCFGQTFNQIDETINSKIGRRKTLSGFTSLGSKNTFGAWGVFVGRSIAFDKGLLEIRIGCGIKESFVVGGGLNFRIYNNKKNFELFVATDYSYNFPGKFRFDDEKAYQPYTSDQYSFTECHYFHSYLTSRIYLDEFAALQLKTGYAFLLNDVKVTPIIGPNLNYSRTQDITNSGLMLGIDLVLFIRYNKDFKKNKKK